MSKVIFTQGIQGSGKSFWAKKFCSENQDWVRVSRDDLRNMRGKYWLPKHEDLITAWEYTLALGAIERGYNVVIDAMNLNQKSVNKFKEFLTNASKTCNLNPIEFEFKNFTDTPLELCIKRDMERPNSIGAKIIRQTWDKYLAPKLEVHVHIAGLPRAIISDMDGTLALFGNKNPYERDFINDQLNLPVYDIIQRYMYNSSMSNKKLIIFSGRTDRFKKETEEWLAKHGIIPDIFEMRTAEEEKAQVKDVLVKQRMFDTFVRGKYNIDFVLDDRNAVVDFWRSLGLTCLQVAPGDF